MLPQDLLPLPRLRLHQRFASSESFMYFAEGLRAMRSYRAAPSAEGPAARELEDSRAAFKDGLTAYPGEPMLLYYYALVCLEKAALIEEGATSEPAKKKNDAGYADRQIAQQREGMIMDALVHFERYQEEKAKQSEPGAGGWAYLWCDYNRAAAQVHRLIPAGYLRARGILTKYLRLGPDVVPSTMPLRHDIVGTHDRVGRGFHLSHKFLTSTETGRTVGQRLSELASRKKTPAASPLPEEVQLVFAGIEPEEWWALFLQMESLLLLTRSRPLREPESMRRLGCDDYDVGLEDVSTVELALEAFESRVKDAYSKGRIHDGVYRDLISDVLSQRGHLQCAHALRAAGHTPQSIFNRWNDLDRPLNNRSAFSILLEGADDDAREWLQKAALSFRIALTHQPRWLPATKNLKEVEAVLCLRPARPKPVPPPSP